MISYRRLNLTQTWPYLGQFDIVFIRNVLIYFDREKKRDILQRMRPLLKPNAYLFIGSAETIIGLGVPFERKQIHGTVCYRSPTV
jgi:chemotaxis protein methyltransferase CheR